MKKEYYILHECTTAKNYKVTVEKESCPFNPRKDIDNDSSMFLALDSFSTLEDIKDDFIADDDEIYYSISLGDMEKFLDKAHEKGFVILPVWYDEGCSRDNLIASFEQPSELPLIGYIWEPKKKGVSKEEQEASLKIEIKQCEQYLNQEVYKVHVQSFDFEEDYDEELGSVYFEDSCPNVENIKKLLESSYGLKGEVETAITDYCTDKELLQTLKEKCLGATGDYLSAELKEKIEAILCYRVSFDT